MKYKRILRISRSNQNKGQRVRRREANWTSSRDNLAQNEFHQRDAIANRNVLIQVRTKIVSLNISRYLSVPFQMLLNR